MHNLVENGIAEYLVFLYTQRISSFTLSSTLGDGLDVK